MIDKVLENLELGPKERSIYKAILEYGKIAPHLISRLTSINRTTVYSVARELKQKGLIVEDQSGKTIYYLPARENDIDKVIANENRKVEDKKNSLRDLQEILKSVPSSKTYSVPKIRFITEEELEEYLYDATKKWSDSISKYDNTIWGFQDPSFAEKYESWIDWFWENVPSNIELKLLTNESDIEKKMESKTYRHVRKMKFFNSDEFTSSQLIHGDFVIFVMTQQKPFYAIEINDSVIAHNLRTLFKNVWDER